MISCSIKVLVAKAITPKLETPKPKEAVSREIKKENGKRFQTKAKSHEMKRGPKQTKPRSIV